MEDQTFWEMFGAKLSWLAESVSAPGTFDDTDLARALVVVSLLFHVISLACAVLAQMLRDRRWVVASRRALLTGAGAVILSAIGLVVSFVRGDYHIQYVFEYSERSLPLGYKVAGLWAGLNGSILFWSMLIGVVSAIVVFGARSDERHRVGRLLEPNVYAVIAGVQIFFTLVIAFVTDPFTPMPHDAVPADGRGLNPLLVSYWMQIHPPSLYTGFVVYTIPFAYGVAALIDREQGNFWIRKTRRWMLIGWLFNTCGIVLGGLWAYEVLGWGGYWAWDPVENASFLPWFTSTAFLHSIMIQERRAMLRVWNVFLVALTFVLSLFGTYLTRSGVVSSVHSFGKGPVGDFFFVFMMIVGLGTLFLIAMRSYELRSRNHIETVASREAIFVLNNLVLVAAPIGIALLTMWPKISLEFCGQAITLGPPVYNTVVNPLFVIMLLLTAIGPSFGWIRTSGRHLRRNLLGPALVSLPLAVGVQFLAHEVQSSPRDALDPLEHIYPTFLVNFFGFCIITGLAYEFLRAVRNRSRRTEDGFAGSSLFLLTSNNRRYGGYFVHVGLAILAIGVVNSSMFKVKEEAMLSAGDRLDVGPYEVTVEGDGVEDKQVYESHYIELSVAKSGGAVSKVRPEKRIYPVTESRRESMPRTEVNILHSALEDFYVYFDESGTPGQYRFTFFRNPLIGLIWIGWLVMIAGGLWAALPMGRRVGLAD